MADENRAHELVSRGKATIAVSISQRNQRRRRSLQGLSGVLREPESRYTELMLAVGVAGVHPGYRLELYNGKGPG